MTNGRDKNNHEKEIFLDEENDELESKPSKTSQKKEMLALQTLGESLVKLSKGELATIPIEDETLAEAIHTAKRIKHREGLRRQMQYIGKLMRKTDTLEIEQAYQRLLNGRKEEVRQFHLLEQWRDKLIETGPKSVEEVITKYPHADRQYLRQIIMRAIKEKELNKPLASARKLFRYLRELEQPINTS